MTRRWQGAGQGLGQWLVLVLLLFVVQPAFAAQPDERLPDAALEARARNLSTELRCLVCQNQSIDDSDAPLARDLRLIVRERLVAGDSDASVREFLVQRYGEFVLLNPRLSARTIVLWALPFAAVMLGMLFLWSRGRRAQAIGAPPLSAEEQERLQKLIGPGQAG